MPERGSVAIADGDRGDCLMEGEELSKKLLEDHHPAMQGRHAA